MSEPGDLNDPALRDRAVRAAQGSLAFDLLITCGQIVDMVTGRIREADIGLVGPLISSVHPRGERNDAAERLDAEGCYISSGLIDMHMHVESSMVTPEAYCAEVLPRGVTTLVWDPHEFGNTCGLAGIDYALRAGAAGMARFITLAPSCVPSAPGFETTGADFTPELLENLLARPEIHGLAEVMSMQAVLSRDPRMSGIVQAGLDSGKRVCGHARGLSGAALNAYAAAGIETDHELTSASDLIEKLEAGLTIELRGSHDHLLPEFVDALNLLGEVPQTLTLCTDDVFVDDLHEKGGLDDVVRRLVRYGLDPVKALRAATLNAATRVERRDLGLVAPGKRADLVLFKDLEKFEARAVVANGELVAREGILLSQDPSAPIDAAMLNTVETPMVSADEFRIEAPGTTANIATIERPRFTKWGSRLVDTKNGFAVCPEDMILMAVINRFGAGTKPRVAFLGEWGKWDGAFATTVSHDSHNITVFGGDEESMAMAANAVIEMGGGLAAVSNGAVLARLALPIAGLVSDAPIAETAAEFSKIREAMDKIVEWEPPYLVFKACFGASLVCNSGPHLSDIGIVDTMANRILKTATEDPMEHQSI